MGWSHSNRSARGSSLEEAKRSVLKPLERGEIPGGLAQSLKRELKGKQPGWMGRRPQEADGRVNSLRLRSLFHFWGFLTLP